jgi:hypothetical protein
MYFYLITMCIIVHLCYEFSCIIMHEIICCSLYNSVNIPNNFILIIGIRVGNFVGHFPTSGWNATMWYHRIFFC